MQSVIWHLFVSHPKLKSNQTSGNILFLKKIKCIFLDRDGTLNKALKKLILMLN